MTRPAIAASLGCRSCCQVMLKAVVSASSPYPLLATRLIQSTPRATSRYWPETKHGFSTSRILEHAEENVIKKEPATADQDHDTETPWYLQVDAPNQPTSQHQVTLPAIPEDAPPILKPALQYIFEDMGLDDISLLDLRDLEEPAALGPNLIMLFGTARSERHLHVSAGRFVRWLSRNKAGNARADGLIGPGELKTKLRRLRKKAKLMGTNTAIVPGGDNGISTGWVCVNFTANEGSTGEAISVDDGGRFSGFGSAPTGTTIVVQCLTESRRSELDLESLWTGILKRSLEKGQKIKGKETPNRETLDAMVSSRLQVSSSPATNQWQAMKRASQQTRYFSMNARDSSRFRSEELDSPDKDLAQRSHQMGKSTKRSPRGKSSSVSAIERWPIRDGIQSSWVPAARNVARYEDDDEEEDIDWDWGSTVARSKSAAFADKLRLLPLAEEVQAAERENTMMGAVTSDQASTAAMVDEAKALDGAGRIDQGGLFHQAIRKMQLSGSPMDESVCFRLISEIFKAPAHQVGSVQARFALVDQVLQTAEERGIPLWTPGRVIDLISAVVSSPLRGPEVRAVQENLEFLLRNMKVAPTSQDTLRLMQTYAGVRDWTRFWDAFRTPPRFMVARTDEQYEIAYRAMAMTQDSKMCTDALRWVYPQMLKEDPPVMAVGSLYEALKACILTADPAAEQMWRDPPMPDNLIHQRQIERREFSRVLRQATELRDALTADLSRRQARVNW